jgi:hypothetical protein
MLDPMLDPKIFCYPVAVSSKDGCPHFLETPEEVVALFGGRADDYKHFFSDRVSQIHVVEDRNGQAG